MCVLCIDLFNLFTGKPEGVVLPICPEALARAARRIQETASSDRPLGNL